jgi:hypothetical protein
VDGARIIRDLVARSHKAPTPSLLQGDEQLLRGLHDGLTTILGTGSPPDDHGGLEHPPTDVFITPVYLVGCYWPGVTSELLLGDLPHGLPAMEQMLREGINIRDAGTILLPGEEAVFSLYEARSEVMVRLFNERAGLPGSRVVEAIMVTAPPGG